MQPERVVSSKEAGHYPAEADIFEESLQFYPVLTSST